jgi:hypothetical protein
LFLTLAGAVRAQDAQALVDKAIKAAGGEEKLSKAAIVSWKTKGTITFMDNENEFETQVTVQGLDHYRSELTGNFGGNPVRGMTVVAGDKGWRNFRDNLTDLDADRLAGEKRTIYLEVVPATLVALKGNKFKVAAAGEETVAGKPASVLKVTAPDGKDFRLSFDKESGLPVKLVADVMGFGGQEFTRETTFAEYKDFGGIKKATKIESKRDGQPFQKYTVTEFKVLDKVPADTFAEPK